MMKPLITDEQAKAMAAMPFLAVSDPRRLLHYGAGDTGLATIEALLSAGLVVISGRVCVVSPAGEQALVRYQALKDKLIDRVPRNTRSVC